MSNNGAQVSSNLKLMKYLSDAFKSINNAYSELVDQKGEDPYKKPENTQTWHLENKITEDLVRLSERKAESRNFKYDLINEFKDLEEGTRIDIAISYHLGIGMEKKIVIECKRLADNRKNKKYIEKGILRFISGAYSKKLPLAGMIGYIEKGEEEKIILDLNSRLENKKLLKKEISDFSEELQVKNTYDSAHTRLNGLGDIELIHMMLDFRKIVILN